MTIPNVSNTNESALTYTGLNRAGAADFAQTVKNKFDDPMSTEAYISKLRQKYGSVTIKSVGKSQEELDAIGKSMSGSDVIIAPNMVEKMAADPALANEYETAIDNFFADEPRMQKIFAAKGLTYEVSGAVIHEDGTLTLICGGGDAPERVAEVNRINRERDEARAAARKLYFENSRQAAAQRRTDYKVSAEKAALRNRQIDLYYFEREINKTSSAGMYNYLIGRNITD